MKRIFFLILSLSILLLSACSPTKETAYILSNTETETVKTVSTETNSSTSTTSNLTNTETETYKTEEVVVSGTSQVTESATKNTEKAAESSVPTKVEQVEITTQVELNNTSVTVTTEPITEEEISIKASASDCSIIADKIIEYINAFRVQEGVGSAVKLSGLTEYAQYRSQQLVINFAHDTVDERVAATTLQYGEYIEPSMYGMTGEPYYTANAREAIAKTSFGGSVADVARHIARMAKNSSNHWNYVGSENYQYIAVGITYKNGNWYCCIAMSRENTDNK